MPNTLPPDSDIHVRVGRLEATINGLAESQTRFTDQMSDFVKEVKVGFAATHNKIDNIVDKIQTSAKTNWPAVGVMFSIIIAVLGYYVNAQVGPLHIAINNNTTAIKTIVDDIESIKNTRYTKDDAKKDNQNVTDRINEIHDAMTIHDELASEFIATQAEWRTFYDLWKRGLLKTPQ